MDKGAYLMSTEEHKLRSPRFFEEVFTTGNLAVNDEPGAARAHEPLARAIFGLALALATEPSKLRQVRQMLVHLREQRGIPESFFTWPLRPIDVNAMSM